MNDNNWEALRAEAESCLSHNFSHVVVTKARHARACATREKWVALGTAVILLTTISTTHWITAAHEHYQNLAQWRAANAQTEILETSL